MEPTEQLSSPKILLFTSSKSDRIAVSAILRDGMPNATLFLAENVDEARRELIENNIDVVLMHGKGVNGNFFERVKLWGKGATLIMYGEQKEVNCCSALKHGADMVINEQQLSSHHLVQLIANGYAKSQNRAESRVLKLHKLVTDLSEIRIGDTRNAS